MAKKDGEGNTHKPQNQPWLNKSQRYLVSTKLHLHNTVYFNKLHLNINSTIGYLTNNVSYVAIQLFRVAKLWLFQNFIMPFYIVFPLTSMTTSSSRAIQYMSVGGCRYRELSQDPARSWLPYNYRACYYRSNLLSRSTPSFQNDTHYWRSSHQNMASLHKIPCAIYCSG